MNLFRCCWFCLALLFACFSVPSASFGQSEGGLPPLGSYSAYQIDSINLQTLNVHFHIPLFMKHARGYNVYLEIEGDTVTCPGTGCLYASIRNQGKEPLPSGAVTWNTIPYACPADPTSSTFYFDEYNFNMPDGNGTQHLFPGYVEDQTECGGSVNIIEAGGPALDDSGYTLSFGTYGQPIITTPGGLTANPDGPYDTNGNSASHIWIAPNEEYKDSTGATISGAGSLGTNQSITYTDSNGAPQTITANCTPTTIYAYYASDLIINGGNQCLITSIGLPDSTSYQIAYEASPTNPSYTTGRPSSITLPGGGTITYQYTGGFYGSGIIPDQVNGNGTAGLIRTTSDGATTYSRTQTVNPGGCYFYDPTCHWFVTNTVVQDPQGNQMTVNSERDNQYNYLETSRTSTNGPTITHSYYMSNGGSGYTYGLPWQSMPGPWGIQEFDVTTSGVGATKTTLNSLSLPSEVDEYDWNSGSNNLQSTPSRKTFTSYATLGNIYDRPSEVRVTDGSGNTMQDTTYGYDESALAQAPANLPNLQATSGARGNLTSVHQWIGNGGALTTTFTYDTAGALLSSTDPGGATTNYGYDSTDTFVASTTLPATPSGVTLSSSATWDFNTGLMTSATDANGTLTQYHYNGYQRATEIDTYDSGSNQIGKTTYNYTQNQISTYQYQNSGTYADTETLYDGYWRVSRTAVFNGQSGNSWYQQDTCYDANGNVGFVSYRYQSSGFSAAKVCSGNGDSYTYDSLGRTTQVAHADGTATHTSYVLRATKTTDENGVSRIGQTDGLGRLVSVCEISSNSSMPASGSPGSCNSDFEATGSGSNVGFLTSYSYSASGGTLTTTINQGGQVRTIQTDWLGRPTMSQQPESGQTTYSYSYNSTGLSVIRTRPRANQTNPAVTTTATTQYDSLGRIWNIVYNDGTPTLSYQYDTNAGWPWSNFSPTNLKGRMYLAYNPGGPAGTTYSYDPAGRINEMAECLPSGCGNGAYDKHIFYSYDWTGNLTSQTDDANGTVAYPRSLAGEITSASNQTYTLTGAAGQATLISNVQRGPFGPTLIQYGNGLYSPRWYDSMGNPSGGWVCSGSTQAGCTGGAQFYGFLDTIVGNQVTAATDTVVNEGATFGYDEFGRLKTQTYSYGPVNTSLSWTYDRYGNRWQQTVTSGSGPQPTYTFNTNTNQITGFTYDAAGNMTNDGIHSYTYDAEGNLTAVDGGSTGQYKYDALNHRVQWQVPGGTGQVVFDADGHALSLWTPSFALRESHIFADGQQIAFRGSDNNTYFVHRDWLDTDRVHTDPNGNSVATWTSLPFGDGGVMTPGGGVATNDFDHFGGMDLNGESNTYQAQFRQYNPTMGRWMSPDPSGLAFADPTNPQSLNLYSYVLNNLLKFTDPNGLAICDMGPGVGGTEIYIDDPTCEGGTLITDKMTVNVFANSGDDDGVVVYYAESVAMVHKERPVAPNSGNPCSSAGAAPDTSVYIAKGNAVRNTAMQPGARAAISATWQNFNNMLSFHRGGVLDAQAYAAPGHFDDVTGYANYVYGVYANAAGMSLTQALQGANLYASAFGKLNGRAPDATYTSTPAANVQSISMGYYSQKYGTTCHK